MVIDEKELPEIFRQKKSDAELEACSLARAAETVLSELSEVYPEQAREDISTMQKLIQRAQSEKTSKKTRRDLRDGVFQKAHDMKGQAALFEYSLLAEIGTVVCDYLREKQEMTPSDAERLSPFITDMETVVREQITDKSGKKATAIRKRLNDAKVRKNG